MEIVEKYKDMAGKWRVRVSITKEEAQFFKFQSEPTDEEVFVQVDKFIKNKNNEVIEESDIDKINRLEKENLGLKELLYKKE